MSTQAQHATNAANSRLSTGPATEAVKQKAAQNLAKHYLTAKQIVVPRRRFGRLQETRPRLSRILDPGPRCNPAPRHHRTHKTSKTTKIQEIGSVSQSSKQPPTISAQQGRPLQTMKSLKIDDRGKRNRIQTSAAYQHAVHLRLRDQSLDIIRLHTAAI